jgi:hypothetical protein
LTKNNNYFNISKELVLKEVIRVEKIYGGKGTLISAKISVLDEKIEKINHKDLEAILENVGLTTACIEIILKVYSKNLDASADCYVVLKKHLLDATKEIRSICEKDEKARDHPKGKRLKNRS